MRWMREGEGHWALAGVVLLAFAGCAATPSAGSARVGSPMGVELPIAARVAVVADPTMPDVRTVEFRGTTWRYADAALMQEAAARVFGAMFQEVGTPPAVSGPVVTLQLYGSSSLNAVTNEYYANASVAVFQGGNTTAPPIASVAGTGRAGHPDFVDDGIAQAYEEAFRQIAELLLADPHFVASLAGY